MYKNHTYYYTCPYCGANLDPGEKCDCPGVSPTVTEKCDALEEIKMSLAHEAMGFICIEDISRHPEAHNIVVYNFNLNPQERLSEFKRIMENRFNHKFTKKELNSLLEYTPQRADELIQLIRSYIFDSDLT